MNATSILMKFGVALALLAPVFTGCESAAGGGSSPTTIYYGTAFHDPWYYGGYHNDIDVIVTPPGLRPSNPIARPPATGPRPTPLPSIPSATRPMPRPAMHR